MAATLLDRIRARIDERGPLSVSDYMTLCLSDPDFGYYHHRDPFGRRGDFVTAPEISQVFGELIGVFLVHAARVMGLSSGVRLIEIGPGRGTMMADIMRVMLQLGPDLIAQGSVHLVETSRRLRDVQKRTLADAAADKRRADISRSGMNWPDMNWPDVNWPDVNWHDSIETVARGPALIVANEFLDALPVRQFVKTDGDFVERMVTTDSRGVLVFTENATPVDPALLPPDAKSQPDGAIFEHAAERNAIMAFLTSRLVRDGGVALIIDYGHLRHGFGDTVQAVRNHAFTPVLDNPGEADLTSHVDFEALGHAVSVAGGHVVGAMTQGAFLTGLGLQERAHALARGGNERLRDKIELAIARLAGTGPGQMGEVFKVLAVSGQPVLLAPFTRFQD